MWRAGYPSFLATALCTSGSEKEARFKRLVRPARYLRGVALVSRMLLLTCDLVV